MKFSGARMKTFLKYFGLAVAVFVASIMFVGCDDVSLDSIEIEGLPSEVMSVGETFELQVVFHPENATDKRVEWWTPQNDLIKLDKVTDTLVSVETLGAGNITILARALDGNLTASVSFEITTGSLNLRFGEAVNGEITRTYNAQPQQVEVSNLLDGVVYTYQKDGETQASLTAPTNVGRYTVTASVNSLNYNGKSEVTLVILPQTIEVRADNKGKTYGASDVALTKRIDGQIFDEDVSIEGSLVRESGENAGNYKILQGQTFVARGDNADNYSVKFIEGNFFISKALVQVNVNVPTIYYGCTPSAVTYTVTGLKNDDVASDLGITIDYPEGMKDAGVYDLVCKLTSINYEPIYSTNKVNVYATPITITVASVEKKYKFDDPEFSYSIYNSKNTDDTSKLFYDDTLDLSVVREQGEDVGTYVINAIGSTEIKNYRLSIVSGSLTIKKRHIGVLPDDATKRYAQADPELTYSFLLASEDYDEPIEGEITVTLSRNAGENVGSYIIEASARQEKRNYIIDTFTGYLNITPALVKLTVDDVTIAYADAEPQYTYTVDETMDALRDDNKFVFEYTREEGTDVGTYNVSIHVLTADNNYSLSTETGVLTIRERYLHYIVKSVSMAYFQAFDSNTLGYELDKTISDENIEAIDISDKVDIDIPWANDVGDYDIVVTLKNKIPNYKIEFSNGVLHIRTAYILLRVNDLEVYYGEDFDPVISYRAGSNVISEDERADKITINLNYYDENGDEFTEYPKKCGAYTMRCTASTPEGKENYVVDITNGTLTLKQGEIHFDIEDGEVVYGHQYAPQYTYDIKGVLTNDINFQWTCSGKDVGEQTINCEIVESEYSANYKVVCDGATLTITPAPVVIDIDAKTFKYGDDVIGLTYSFGEGTDEVFLTDTSNLTVTLSGSKNNVGKYDIICTYSEADEKNNYSVTVNGAQYEIVQREYKLKIQDTSKIYGNADPAFSFVLTNESDALLDGDVVQLSYNRASGEGVGNYEITATENTLGANYNVTIQSGELTINKRNVTITADNVQISVGETPQFTYVITGDGIIEGDVTFELVCDGEEVGTHVINVNITKNNENYNIECVAGQLTIVDGSQQE